jgi:hypothetical protein
MPARSIDAGAARATNMKRAFFALGRQDKTRRCDPARADEPKIRALRARIVLIIQMLGAAPSI